MAEYQSFDGHGVDVAVNRADDLDKQALEYIAAHADCTVLDLGSGAGGQSVRMATAGARVMAVDQFDFEDAFAALRTEHSLTKEQLDFLAGDIVQLESLVSDKQFTVTTIQRTIHYLPYDQAREALAYVHSITTDKLYISVTGSGSLVGDTYPCQSDALIDRFCTLSDLGKDMFQIHESVCLYSQDEFAALLQEAGWQIESIWSSAFGNVKAVCGK